MQRRVAAVYFAFFLVMGASAYSVIAVADKPAIQIEGETYGEGDTFQVEGQQYRVATLEAETSEGGGHGGGGGGSSLVGTLEWTNESAQFSAELANNTTTTFREGTYRVLIANTSDPESVTLHQEFNVTALLVNDSAVYNQTVTVDGQERVVFRADNSTEPLDEYLPAPDAVELDEGETFDLRGNESTVRNVTAERALVAWRAPDTNTRELTEGGNITLSGQQFVVHFESADAVQISPEVAAYQDEVAKQDRFQERTNGLWAITILSSIAAVALVGMAYLPVRG